MKGFLKQFVRTKHEIMTNDRHMVDVLKVLHRHKVSSGIDVAICDCKLDGGRWYVDFYATGRQMKSIVPELSAKDINEIVVIKNYE